MRQATHQMTFLVEESWFSEKESRKNSSFSFVHEELFPAFSPATVKLMANAKEIQLLHYTDIISAL